MTTPDRLREAARVLRERAEAATPGPWTFKDPFISASTPDGEDCVVTAADDGAGAMGGIVYVPDGRYIATMHPGVTLAVAEWLDLVAEVFPGSGSQTWDELAEAFPFLRVADAILGGAE